MIPRRAPRHRTVIAYLARRISVRPLALLLAGFACCAPTGRPPLALQPGQSYQIPANAVQWGHSGEARSKLIAVFVIEEARNSHA
jgi:hypothetical protein